MNGLYKVCAIIASAGSGRRMRSEIDKPFIRLCGNELIYYVLKELEESPLVSEIIIAARLQNIHKIKRLIKNHGFTKIREIVKGGSKRSLSVFNALSRVKSYIDFVLIHDVARPFISHNLIRKTIVAARRYSAAISAVPVKPTIKQLWPNNSFIRKTLERKFLWEAQTPQVFRKDLLIAAYKKADKRKATFSDEACLIEDIKRPVKVVMGSYNNIKITTPEDLAIAEAIYKKMTKLK